MKKLLALLLCLVLLPLCAFQEETHPLKEILDSAEKMLFQTERETLGISSEFYYDGEYFKTVNGEYVQDGADSLLDLKLSTVDYDGSVLKSGYRVMAKDGVAYSHSYGVWGYDVFTPEEDTTPLRYNSEYGSFFRLIHAVSPLLENLLQRESLILIVLEESLQHVHRQQFHRIHAATGRHSRLCQWKRLGHGRIRWRRERRPILEQRPV